MNPQTLANMVKATRALKVVRYGADIFSGGCSVYLAVTRLNSTKEFDERLSALEARMQSQSS